MDDIEQFELTGVTVTPTAILIDANDSEGHEVEFVFSFGDYPRPATLAGAAAGLATRAAHDASIVERAAKL